MRVSVAQLQFLVIASVYSVNGSFWVYPLKPPELVSAAMARVLYDRIFMLVSSRLDINIHLIEEAFDDIDLTCLVDVPSLIVPVIGLVYYQFFTLFFRSIRNVDQFLCVSGQDKASFFDHLIGGYLNQSPHINKALKFALFQY
jgi:hypothetical protein